MPLTGVVLLGALCVFGCGTATKPPPAADGEGTSANDDTGTGAPAPSATAPDAARAPARDGGTGPEAVVRPPDAGAGIDAPSAVRLDAGVRLDVAAAAMGPAAAAQCQKDSDCQLVNDCCTCAAIPKGEKVPACDPKTACLIPSCMQFGGVEQPRCAAGRCVLGFDCDTASVTCKRAAPVCPAGQVPRVVMQGVQRCFGECMDARQCLAVPSCASCARADLCVRTGAATSLHCVAAPSSCTTASCACVGPSVCGGYGSCQTGMPPNPSLVCE
jgi:hypothetical protein